MNGNYRIGDVVMDNWTLVRKLGEGSYGTVYEAHREDFNTLYTAAIKIVTIPSHKSSVDEARAEVPDEISVTRHFEEMVQELSREVSLMSRFKGTANVVSYEDHLVIPHEDGVGWDILLRMELLTPITTLRERLLSDSSQVLKLGIDICKALELLGKQGILHRDIKLANVFLSRHGDYKLGDFGIAKVCARPLDLTSRQGTNTYMAPEVFWGKPYGPAADLYSLGIVLYRLTNDNRAPFLPDYPQPIRDEDRAVAEAKRHGGKALPAPKNAGAALARVILKACAFQPEDRYESPQALRNHLQMLLEGKDRQVLLDLEDAAGDEKTRFVHDEADDATVIVASSEEDETATVVSAGKTGKPRWMWLILAIVLLLLLGAGLALGLESCNPLPAETVPQTTALMLPVSEFRLQVGQSLKPEVYGCQTDGATLPCPSPQWTSSNDAVVLARGDMILGISPGTVILTVTVETDGGELEYFCSAVVEAPADAPTETAAPTEETEPAPTETQPPVTEPQEAESPSGKPKDPAPAETEPPATKPQETKPVETQPPETEPLETQPPQVTAPTGYRISASNSSVYAFQEFTVWVTPHEEDVDVTVYARDPSGKVWTFHLGQRRYVNLYVDQLDLVGTWTIYASISNDAGTYNGASGGPSVKVSVKSPF